MAVEAIETVAGVHGTELTEPFLAQLPDEWPPAPWPLDASAIAWVTPARMVRGALQPGMVGRPVAVAGMFVRSASTPVGEYDEVAGIAMLRRGRHIVGHCPFMAVDS